MSEGVKQDVCPTCGLTGLQILMFELDAEHPHQRTPKRFELIVQILDLRERADRAEREVVEVRKHLAARHAAEAVTCRLCHPMMIERDAAQARVAEMEAMLGSIEWNGRTNTGTQVYRCPVCGGAKPAHADDCKLAKAILLTGQRLQDALSPSPSARPAAEEPARQGAEGFDSWKTGRPFWDAPSTTDGACDGSGWLTREDVGNGYVASSNPCPGCPACARPGEKGTT